MKVRWLIIVVVAIVVLSYFTQSYNFLNPREGVWSVAGNTNYTSGSYSVPGLVQPVNVTIDQSGVAHISAQNLHDLFLAQGYYSASNRLFQMELQGLLATGNLSKYIGQSGLGSDMAIKLIGLPENAVKLQHAYESQYPTYYSYLQDYASGVDAYINHTGNAVPLEFKLLGIKPYQWTVYDTLAWQQYMAWSLTTGAMEPLQSALLYSAFGFSNTTQIWPYYPYYTENVTVVPGDGTVNGFNLSQQGISPSYLWSLNWYQQWATGVNDTLLKSLNGLIKAAISNISDPYNFPGAHGIGSAVGSNSWEVTSGYAKNGFPILANDPHLPLSVPSLWIPMQLSAGPVNVTGWDLAGVPGILIGHTPKTAWGLTTPEGNSANDYLEMLNGTNYLFNGSWHRMAVYNYTLLGAQHSIYYTNNGPIIAREGNYGISLRWTASTPSFDLITEIMLDQSANYSDMVNALKHWGSPPQNFAMVSDASAGTLTAGIYPLIKETLPDNQTLSVVGSRTLLNGTLPAYEPAGNVQFDHLPQAKNPARGYMLAPNQPTAWKNYPDPFVGGFWASGGRAQTIYHFLRANPNMTVQKMMNLQSNVSDYWATQLTPMLLNALKGVGMNSTEQSAYTYLSDWNYTTYQSQIGITVYWYLVSSIYNNTFDRIYKENGVSGEPLPFVSSLIHLARTEPNSTWLNGNFTQLVRSSFEQEVSLLSDKLGSTSNWQWGNVHKLVISSQTGLSSLSIGPLPIWGDSHTVSVGSVPLSMEVPEPNVAVGSSLRQISSPGQSTFYGVFPGGPSGNVISYYYSNQLSDWLSHSYYNMNDQKTEVKIRYVAA
ncbi:penicillin acylase [uncultured archaeon]|nr:penicillin acylase [uncultured archaeon]